MLSYLETAIGFVVIMLGISLMIMILTQAISAALSYRGSTLMWGLAALFKNIDPKLKSLTANADALAKAVLTHSLVSDSVLTDIGGGWIVELLRKVTGMFDSLLEKFRLASAIRPDELVAILTHLANNPSLLPSQDAQLVADIKELLASQNPLIQRQVDFVRGAIGLAEAALANATPVIQDAVDAVGKVGGKLESWFNATMDRVSQRFSMHVRICTIVLAFLSAVVLQLDAVELVRNLFTNSDARAAFAGIADNMSSIAQNLLPGGGTADQVQTSMTKIFTDAVNNAETANNVQDATATGIASRADGESWQWARNSGLTPRIVLFELPDGNLTG